MIAVERDRRIGRDVAIRRMEGEVTPEAVDRFCAAARLQGRLEHPALEPVLDLGLDGDGRPWFAMRRVRGAPLAEIVRRRAAGELADDARYRTRRLLAAFVDVCLAVEYAHAAGVVHRALGAEHVLIGDFGDVYLREWGQAREAEVADPVEVAADVAALGRILFEIVCQRPLEGDDVAAAARAAGRHGPPELLDAIAGALDGSIASARDLAAAVQRWLDGVRDLARRRELAARHRERARAAADAGDRATALREAGSAVALDPRDREATELLGRLVLEPPDEASREGAAIEAASDAAEIRSQAKVAAASYLSVPATLPLLAWLGIEQLGVVIAIGALGLIQAALALAAARGRFGQSWVWIATGLNVVLLACYARVFGPVIGVPAMAATIVMAAVALPGVRPWWLVPALMLLGVLGPAALELAGVLGRTTDVTAGGVIIRSAVVRLPLDETLIVLAAHTVALIFVAVNYGRLLTQSGREARARLLSQAWHLEQLARRAR